MNAWLPRGGSRTTKPCWWGGRDRSPTQLGFGGPEGVDAWWQHAAGVPFDLDAGMRLQTRLQDVEKSTRTAGPREDIDVI